MQCNASHHSELAWLWRSKANCRPCGGTSCQSRGGLSRAKVSVHTLVPQTEKCHLYPLGSDGYQYQGQLGRNWPLLLSCYGWMRTLHLNSEGSCLYDTLTCAQYKAGPVWPINTEAFTMWPNWLEQWANTHRTIVQQSKDTQREFKVISF